MEEGLWQKIKRQIYRAMIKKEKNWDTKIGGVEVVQGRKERLRTGTGN